MGRHERMTQQSEVSIIEQLWKDYYQLYIKFCGIADEFHVIKHRWNFLRRFTWSLTANPHILEATEELIHKLEEHFKIVGCRRESLEGKDQFITQTGSIGFDLASLNLTAIQYLYEELSSLLGHLKQAFYQRTVSLEVPSTITGVSQSPERTMGNELMLLAADKLTESYLDCTRQVFPWKWDGVISFLYPHLTAFGGLTRWYHPAKTFHISLTEDGKYFIGDYLTLAHEVAHTTMYASPTTSKPPLWLSMTINEMRPIVLRELHRLREIYYESECMDCTLFRAIYSFIKYGWSDSVIESLTDLIAVKIGGVSSLQHLIDLVLQRDTFSRLAFAHGFDPTVNEVAKDFNDAKRRLCSIHKYECARECVELLASYGKSLGQRFATLNVELPERVDDYQRTLQLPAIDSANDSQEPLPILSHLVSEELQMDENEERIIESNLSDLESCTAFDPRRVLHVYYKIYREKGNPPNYAVTLHSLAFNKLQKKGIE
jgi:hypothetical protein